jgi:hypothetical protein
MEAIDYATRERQHGWLRRNVKRTVVAAICAAVGIVAYRLRTPVTQYVAWQYYHWQLSRYAMSPRDAIAPPTTVPTSPTAGTRHVAAPLAALNSRTPPNYAGMRYGRAGTPGYDYVGQRRRPDGASRTVVLALQPEMYQPFARATIAVIRRPGPFTGPPNVWFACGLRHCDDSGPTSPALVECADDPTDASAIRVSLHPVGRATDAVSYRPTRIRARLTNADALDWTVESHDPNVTPIVSQPPTFNRTTAAPSLE